MRTRKKFLKDAVLLAAGSLFHSGLFVWISFYFNARFHFGHPATGLALLLFSLPGLLMAVSIGLAIKKYGNARMVFWGSITVIVTLVTLLANTSFWLTVIVVAFLIRLCNDPVVLCRDDRGFQETQHQGNSVWSGFRDLVFRLRYCAYPFSVPAS